MVWYAETWGWYVGILHGIVCYMEWYTLVHSMVCYKVCYIAWHYGTYIRHCIVYDVVLYCYYSQCSCFTLPWTLFHRGHIGWGLQLWCQNWFTYMKQTKLKKRHTTNTRINDRQLQFFSGLHWATFAMVSSSLFSVSKCLLKVPWRLHSSCKTHLVFASPFQHSQQSVETLHLR